MVSVGSIWEIYFSDKQYKLITLDPAEYLNFKSIGFGQALQYLAKIEKLVCKCIYFNICVIAGVLLKNIIISI